MAHHPELAEQLKQQQERFSGDLSDQGVVLLDRNGYIQSWSSEMERIHGYKEDEVLGNHFSIFYTVHDLREHLTEKLLQQAEKFGIAHSQGKRLRKGGSEFWGKCTLMPIRDDNGELLGFTKLVREYPHVAV